MTALEGGFARRDSSGRAFLAVLRCRLEGYSAARFCEYLSAGRVPGAHPSWERLINEAAVIGGFDRWRERLSGDQYENRLISPGGTLSEGGVADITVLAPDAGVTIRAAALKSKSKNTPFDGWSMRGGVAATIVGARTVYVNDAVALRV